MSARATSGGARPAPGRAATSGTPRLDKIVLAYSGGLDTSVILRWLIEEYGCEVVAFCADLGQGDELDTVRARATAGREDAGCQVRPPCSAVELDMRVAADHI